MGRDYKRYSTPKRIRGLRKEKKAYKKRAKEYFEAHREEILVARARFMARIMARLKVRNRKQI